jgi:hypothetical protein
MSRVASGPAKSKMPLIRWEKQRNAFIWRYGNDRSKRGRICGIC